LTGRAILGWKLTRWQDILAPVSGLKDAPIRGVRKKKGRILNGF
jgi:hypothetical protein